MSTVKAMVFPVVVYVCESRTIKKAVYISACSGGDRRPGFNPWIEKIPWKRKW